MTTGKLIGPWKCEKCGNISQFAIQGISTNRIFCKNESCEYTRLVDKENHIIVETDHTTWRYDGAGNKERIRG